MSGNRKSTREQNLFIQGFTGESMSIQENKRKKPLTQKEAEERRKRRNAKYDQNGNLR